MKPRVSVILPTYNRAHILWRAVQSVLAQTDARWELIIVDDGSTDCPHRMLEEFRDPRISIVATDNRGPSAALPAGQVGFALGLRCARQTRREVVRPNPRLLQCLGPTARMLEPSLTFQVRALRCMGNHQHCSVDRRSPYFAKCPVDLREVQIPFVKQLHLVGRRMRPQCLHHTFERPTLERILGGQALPVIIGHRLPTILVALGR